jgi:threonine dehydratase
MSAWRAEAGRIVNDAPAATVEQAPDIDAAAARIVPYALRTELRALPLHGADVVAKLECLQHTGSFKVRGAANRLLTLDPAVRERGVVTASSGNHGRAVAHVAHELGVRAIVCLPSSVDPVKLEAIRSLGAEPRMAETYDEAALIAERVAAEDGLTFVHAFDDPEVIAGQGTVGAELVDDAGPLDAVLVPLSGGGLAAGVALAVKARSPVTRVVGVSAANAAVLHGSLLAGRPVQVPERPSLASALSGGLGAANHHSLRLVSALLDEALLVDEAAIAAAMRWARDALDLVVEGGGAVSLAPLLAGDPGRWGRRVAAIVSGGNVDPATLARLG